MWILLILIASQANNLRANHPDCGKQEKDRVSSGLGVSNGPEASIFKNPWSIAILLSEDLHCSGSMISEKYVLSAAHCFLDQGVRLDQKKMEILAGSFDPTNPEEARKKARFIERKKIRDVKIHPEFVYPAAAYDLALVKIEGQFNFRDTRWPICLPEISAPRDSHSRIGFILLGFGRDTSAENQGSVLTELDLTVQPVAACSTLYGKILDDEYDDLYTQTKMTLPKSFEEDSLICAQKPGRTFGSCPGDSGGIFMKNEWVNSLEDYRAFQIAVVHGAAQICYGQRYPQILVRLDKEEVLTWINRVAFTKEENQWLETKIAKLEEDHKMEIAKLREEISKLKNALTAHQNLQSSGLKELQDQVVKNTMAIKNNFESIKSIPVAECFNYQILNDARRHYTKDLSGNPLCDNVDNLTYKNKNWKGRNFYRVMAPAGTKIKEGCVAGTNACGTNYQGYITVGTHPTLLNQRVKMTVCFKAGSVCPPSSCGEVEIEAINCGSYYVYDLPDTPGCAYAYCTE